MTQDEIIPLPQYLNASYEGDDLFTGKQLIEYAKLVAEREREAIAQMVEDAPPLVHFCKNNNGGCLVCGFTPSLAAKTIRARGNQ